MKRIDTHTHIDFFDNPEKTMQEYDSSSVLTIYVTYLPQIFEKYYNRALYKHIRIALGYHPQMVLNYEFDKPLFDKYIDSTHYIGEVGLDYTISKEDVMLERQFNAFRYICNKSKNSKILSVHSKRAEKDALNLLVENNVKHAIFHWYTGPLSLIGNIVDAGYYFSVNSNMLSSAKGRKTLGEIPIERLLIESDGPFTKYNGAQYHPDMLPSIYNEFAKYYGLANFENVIFENFSTLLKNRKCSSNQQKSNIVEFDVIRHQKQG